MENKFGFKKWLVCLLCFLPFSGIAQSEEWKITGKIVEAGSLEPVPFAHVFIKGTQLGTSSSLDGEFTLVLKRTLELTDTLVVSSLGYVTQKIKEVTPQTNLTVALEPELRMMNDLIIEAGENPAYAVMESVIHRKEENNPDRLTNYSCEEYAKVRFDLNHLTEKVKNNIVLRPFDYIWSNSDTTSDGVSFLPVLLVEKVSEHYYRQSPKKNKSIVHAKNVVGLPGPKILEFVEELYFTPNIYDEYVIILDKNFPSPLNSNFKLHYEYYLDSATTDIGKEYHLSFQPKMKRDLAFVGEMKVDSGSYAVKSISLRFDIMANVNFVRSYLVEQKYDKVNDEHWMLNRSDVLGDYTVIENSSDLTGFFGRKSSFFENYVIDTAAYKKDYDGSTIIVETDSASLRTETYWVDTRKDELDEKELGVKQMVDELESDPDFILRKNIVKGFTTGYIPWKSMDIGDFYTFYSYNYIENSRLKFGFRTTPYSPSPGSLSLYGAYGFRDEKWKYGLETSWKLGKGRKILLSAGIRDDIIQLGRSVNAIAIDHVLASLVQIGSSVSRIYERNIHAGIAREITTGLVAKVDYFHTTVTAADTVRFRELESRQVVLQDNYTASGLEFTMKFSGQNRRLAGDFYDREDLKKEFRRYPDLSLNYKYSGGEFGADVSFHQLTFRTQQYLRTRKLGYFRYTLEAGFTEGAVPYPFLNTPFSNQLVLHDDMAFNLMKNLEFVADRYLTANLQQHFDGLIMDRVPLINRLKWRSFVFAKGYWGKMSDQNLNSEFVLPTETEALDEPYFEVGFGLENIFKIARVDFIWRLNETTTSDSYHFIVKPSFQFSF